ncbi:MAG: phenylalanine--tRNA ligase subunit beta [Candidatus Harrisonbacteria bacterium]|nr:phenylalanine--tRNA ligase subunit beta [Candidatus Harrisonbacteria bacterium]
MKFSYYLLKKLNKKIPDKKRFIDKFNLHAFEAEDAKGDALEISIPANRYSDASSHWGIAKVAAAIFGGKTEDFSSKKPIKSAVKKTAPEITISSKGRCPRYLGRYFEISKVGQSPEWLKNILASCGLRPINAVVDVMNYVMLEVGQPLHAFDAELLAGSIDVRLANKDEEIKTIDGGEFALINEDLVIADDNGPLAIAGIKGGKRAEVSSQTRKIVVEAANFEATGIYKTSRRLNLFTDASARFSHGISPMLAEIGMNRAAELLKEVCKAKVGDLTEINYAKLRKTILVFDVDEFNQLTGLNLDKRTALDCLKRLGFKIIGKKVEAPPLRADIFSSEDLAEEIINLYGYQKLPETAPSVPLSSSVKENDVMLKENLRNLLRGYGFSELYNYSFTSRKALTVYGDHKWWNAVSLRNPISSDFQYLRPSLAIQILQNAEDNLRFYDTVRIFEIGKVFTVKESEVDERLKLGLAISFKKTGDPILELKGIIDQLLRDLGLTEFFFRDLDWDLKFLDHGLRVESDHHVVGYLGVAKSKTPTAIAELDLRELLELVVGEKEYRPLPKYPSVMRDISVSVTSDVRVGPIQDLIENSSHILADVDLVDWFENAQHVGAGRKSLTFRLVFQTEDRTLTDEEVNKEMDKITAALKDQFDAEIR